MRWYVFVTYCVSGALCGEALEFLELFPEGGSKRDLGWCLKIFPFASLGSEAGGGVVALRGTFKQRRSRLLAPRQGGGVRLRGAVWLSRSPFHPVCRYDEVICSEMTRRVAGARDENQNAVSVRNEKC